MIEQSFMRDTLIFLLAAMLAVPIFHRLKLGSALAFLFTGALLGPNGFSLLSNNAEQVHLAELGVVFLLFLVGLELSPARIWLMRHAALKVGGAQVFVSAIAIGLVAMTLGFEWQTAWVIGSALALSSTAMDIELLAGRKQLGSVHGRHTISVLIFQDIVTVPAIALVPLLGASAVGQLSWESGIIGSLKIVAVLFAVVLAGRYVSRPLLNRVVRTRSTEAFTATTLLIVLGTAWLTSLVGLPMSLGAFLAGVLLAESEYRHEIESQIEPFKGLLLGVFFLSVGLSVNWQLVVQQWFSVIAIVLCLMLGKAIILFGLLQRFMKANRDDALRTAILLSQGGEFAFVLLKLGLDAGAIPSLLNDQLIAAVVLSMALTPLAYMILERWMLRHNHAPAPVYDEVPDDLHPKVIVAGFGRFGQIVARILTAQKVPFITLENSLEQIEVSRRLGVKIYYGDPSKPELLRAAHADRASFFVLALDDPEISLKTAKLVRSRYPHLKLLARARNRRHAFHLMDLGIENVVRENLYSSLELARQLLIEMGLPSTDVEQRIERFRDHDQRLLHAQHRVHQDDEGLIQTTREAWAELADLFEADREHP